MRLHPCYLLKSFVFTWRIGRTSENSKNTWIYMVEWHRVDGAVFCQIIFVGGIISMPGHHIEWRVILKKIRIIFIPLTSLIREVNGRGHKYSLKVRQSRNDFFKLTFLLKNERTNLTLLLWYLRSTCFRSFFGGNWRHQKDK